MKNHDLLLRNRCPKSKTEFARKLRKSPTPAEAHIWEAVRCSKLGVRAKRQSVIRGYIADLWIPSWLLIVEIDGSVHDSQMAKDKYRDESLAKIGIRTIRFSNAEVFRDRRAVVAAIKTAGLSHRYPLKRN